jgi:hypothetical protein
MASRLNQTSASLLCDDRRFIDAAEDRLGGPVIPECPEGVLSFAEAGRDNDDGIGVRGVKVRQLQTYSTPSSPIVVG